MSWMEEASTRQEYHYADLGGPVRCRTRAEDAPDEGFETENVHEHDELLVQSKRPLWIVPNNGPRGEHPGPARNLPHRSTNLVRARNLGARGRAEARSLSVPREESRCVQFHEKQVESVADQIRRFQENADLRECLLPGMLSKISRKACEGWQRQTTARSSSLMAKIKLDPCRSCQYFLESSAGAPASGNGNGSSHETSSTGNRLFEKRSVAPLQNDLLRPDGPSAE